MDNKPRMVIIGAGGKSLGRAVALTFAELLAMHVEFQEELDKIQGLEYDHYSFDEIDPPWYFEGEYFEGEKRSRGKGKKNKPWEHNFRG